MRDEAFIMVEVLKVIRLCFIPLIINYYLNSLCYCIMCINRKKSVIWFFYATWT